MVLLRLSIALVVATLTLSASARIEDRATLVGRDDELLEEYDYVIVGGGTSGLTVANRLTEGSDVLMIEPGQLDDQEPSTLIPGSYIDNSAASTKYFYPLRSVPQRHLRNTTEDVYAARVVGGGSVVNGMIFDRGSAGDYALWALLGSPGWDFSGLLPFFRKSETFNAVMPKGALAGAKGFSFEADANAHGTDGPVRSSMPGYFYPTTGRFFEAFGQMGVEYVADATGGRAVGLFWLQGSVDPVTRTRSYARTAYYEPARKRKNFHLLTGNTVTKINFNRRKTATGVSYARNATAEVNTVRARREVVLAAGAIHTPQLLLLSGIGDKTQLQQTHRIEVIADLPGVGYNLQDHPSLYFRGTFAQDLTPNPAQLHDPAVRERALTEWKTNATGPYTLSRGSGAAFLTLAQVAGADAARTMLTSFPTVPTDDADVPEAVQRGYAAQRALLAAAAKAGDIAVCEAAFAADPGIAVSLQHPLSRGRVALNITSAFVAPLVDYRVLSHPADLAMLTAIEATNQRVFAMPALAALQPAIQPMPVRQNLAPTMGHLCGTAAMLPRRLGGVVDERLRVYGVRGLRIVDAAIVPIVPATHLCSTVYAVAEKASVLIQEDAGRRRGR